MKKIIYVFLVLLVLCLPALAVDWIWDQHTDTGVIGYNFYWAESNSPTEVFYKNLPGIDTITYTVDDLLLKHNISYDFWVTAYNITGESGPSTIVPYTRVVQIYTPPADNLPTEQYPVASPVPSTGLNNT